ncbi:hypothetical protein GW17_00059973 [Ensete ventricosum]|nr:hypothetical protein GW17_00059973 [Ensete ventricosum]
MTSILKFRDGARKIDRNSILCWTLRKVYRQLRWEWVVFSLNHARTTSHVLIRWEWREERATVKASPLVASPKARRGRTTIASVIDDFRHGRATTSSPLGMGWPLGLMKGGVSFSPRRLMVSRATDAMDVPAGCSSASFFTTECPSPAAVGPFTVGAFTAGGGCSSPQRPVSQRDVPSLVFLGGMLL